MKYVNSYWAEILENGVIHLLINCTQKEIYYHSFNYNKYIIAGSQEEYESNNKDLIFELENFIPNNKDIIYVTTHRKEGSQLSYYFIPYNKNNNINRDFITLKLKNKQ